MKLLAVCLLLLLTHICDAQTITTIAGNGTMAVTGDGGPATLAGINQPNDLCVDATGSLFFCFGAGGVRKIDNAGIITHFAGGAPVAMAHPQLRLYLVVRYLALVPMELVICMWQPAAGCAR